jgi:integrase
MRFSEAIDAYIADQKLAGRINSPKTETAYRSVLDRHAVDIANRDPRLVGRDDVKRTLARWPNPNTQRCSRSILVAFYDWTGEEGIRDTNPARLTRRPKRRPSQVYRLNRAEVAAILDACETTFERRALYLGICAGLRSAELRGLQGLHFERDGWIWVSADIAKGGKERWVPVTIDLEPIVNDIQATVAPAHFVLHGSYVGGGAHGSPKIVRIHPERGCSSQHLQRTVAAVATRAGIAAHIHPHLMRHAYAQHVARHAGVQVTRAVMGHADIRTTQAYLDEPDLDEIAVSVQGISFRGYTPTNDPIHPARRGRDSNPRSPTSRPAMGGTPTADEWETP